MDTRSSGYFRFWALKRQENGDYIAVPYITIYPEAGLIEIRKLQDDSRV